MELAPHLARWTVVLVPLLAGCAASPVAPAILEDGKSLWRRVESEHFVVESNLAVDGTLCGIANDYEILWQAFTSVPILGLRAPREKPLVVVLRSNDEFRYLAGAPIDALFFDHTALGPLILMPPDCGVFRDTLIKHELAHFVGAPSLEKAPQWLDEGLAQVMETASYEPGAGKILFGNYSDGLLVGAAFELPAERFTQPWPAELAPLEQQRYHGRSWLLVHYLVDQELQPFLNFLVRIRNGEDWQSAWRHELALQPQEIDAVLQGYFERCSTVRPVVGQFVPSACERWGSGPAV